MEALLNAAKEKEVCQKLDELNFTIRETKWICILLVIHARDGHITVEELIATMIATYIILAAGAVITVAWNGFKGGFSRAWAKRKEAQKLKVMRNA
jgi:hypothetical protein